MKLYKLAKVLRSKNAGPFVTTFDIFFERERDYLRVRDSGVLTQEYIAGLYHIKLKDVLGIYHLDAANGIKITIKKPEDMATGDPHCRDTYSAQQYLPLLDIEIPQVKDQSP